MMRIAKSPIGFIALCSLSAFSGCEKHSPDKYPKEIKTAKEATLSLQEWYSRNGGLIRAEQDFAFKLLQNLQDDSLARNQFFSPLSLQIALGMIWNGAKNGTADSMAAALGWTGMPKDSVASRMSMLQEALLIADSKVKIEIANAVFHHNTFVPDSGFLNQNKESYNALVQALDFSKSKQALETINGWANKKTNGKIPRVLEKITPSNMVALCNAVYFKGEWSKVFDTKLTVTGDFNLYIDSKNTPPESQRTSKTRFLHHKGKMDYFDDDEAQWARIPYGDSLFSMTVVLPKAGKSLSGFTESLTAESWTLAQSRLQLGVINFFMPKHKIEVSYEKEMENALTKMGMGIVFSGQADFSGVTKAKPVSIGAVIHKSFIETDEKGSEAAAVTVVKSYGSRPDKAKTIPVMRLNRPYLYAITEKQSGAILFLGVMNNPNPTGETR